MRLHEPTDKVSGLDLTLEHASVLDFWKWAFSYLSDDAIKGEFAEWLVGKLLGLEMKPGGRIQFNDWDLRYKGVKIEVKTSVICQMWNLRNKDGTWKEPVPLENPSKGIYFRGLYAAQNEPTATKRDFKSDLYVFCLQTEKSPANWNALDIRQWSFFMLTGDQLRRIKSQKYPTDTTNRWKTFGLSLKDLKQYSQSLCALCFRREGQILLNQLATARNMPSTEAHDAVVSQKYT